jgi:3-methylcrotonyl-CoA carboxylase alpha subunit
VCSSDLPLKHLIFPESSSSVRVESGVRAGDEVSVHYDPMIAKLVVWDESRYKSLNKLKRVLMQTKITGLKTNIDFLLRLASHKDFVSGDVYTDFIPDHGNELITSPDPSESVVRAAAFGLLSDLVDRSTSLRPVPPDLQNFRIISSSPACERVSMNYKDHTHDVLLKYNGSAGAYLVSIDGGPYQSMTGELDSTTGELVITCGGRREVFTFLKSGETVTIFTNNPSGNSFVFQNQHPKFMDQGSDVINSSSNGKILSPMPGVVEHVFVKAGDKVSIGDPLIILIAMKMEYTLKSPADGTVGSVPFGVGKNVPKGALLVTIDC